MAVVRATASSRFMPLKKTAMAKEAACPSVTVPEVMPETKAAISSADSFSPSRFLRMIS